MLKNERKFMLKFSFYDWVHINEALNLGEDDEEPYWLTQVALQCKPIEIVVYT